MYLCAPVLWWKWIAFWLIVDRAQASLLKWKELACVHCRVVRGRYQRYFSAVAVSVFKCYIKEGVYFSVWSLIPCGHSFVNIATIMSVLLLLSMFGLSCLFKYGLIVLFQVCFVCEGRCYMYKLFFLFLLAHPYLWINLLHSVDCWHFNWVVAVLERS